GGGRGPAVEVTRGAGEEIVGGGIQHRRGVMHGRIDEAMIGVGVAAAGREPGCRPQRWMRGAAFALLGHGSILCTARRCRPRLVPTMGSWRHAARASTP